MPSSVRHGKNRICTLQILPGRGFEVGNPRVEDYGVKLGLQQLRASTLFDSKITFSADAISARIFGIASASRPRSVRTHSDRTAPAAR